MKDGLRGRTVLITGGTGFIGRHLARAAHKQGARVTVLSRDPAAARDVPCRIAAGDLTRPATLRGICDGVDTVFHLAGNAHAFDEPDEEVALLSARVTTDGTRRLLAEAARAGVRAFVFFSSVKAMGEGGEACLDETAGNPPLTGYGKAKRAAEQAVLGTPNMAATVLRLPLVYGPGCKGNLPRMIRAVARGRFPPLPETNNRRSMVDVRDVVQAALLAATHPVAAGNVYIVTDGQAYSSRRIYESICAALRRPVPRWTLPVSLLRIMARAGNVVGRLTRRRFVIDIDSLEKLIGSAHYSSAKIQRDLNYRPVHRLEDSLPEMCAGIIDE